MRHGNYGKKRTDEHKRHYSESKLAEKNPMWKGDDVGVNALHAWIRKNLTISLDGKCDLCHKKQAYDVANICSKYNPKTYNRHLKNWYWECRSCHMNSDGRMKNLEKNQVKGRTPWNRGKKGLDNGRKGKKHSDESKKKMSESAKKRWKKLETK